MWSSHVPITINAQSNWPLQVLCQEIVLMCSDHPKSFYFKLDGHKVRSRRESEMKCVVCAQPHVIELIESQTYEYKKFLIALMIASTCALLCVIG